MIRSVRGVWAVLAGLVLIVVLSSGTDFLFERMHIFPPPIGGMFTPAMLSIALVYRCVYAVIGGYVTAGLNCDKPMRHAFILGLIGTVVSIAGLVIGWDLPDRWYPVSLAVTALPFSLLGGRAKVKEDKEKQQ